MNSHGKKTSLRQRFWIVMGSLLFIVALVLVFVDMKTRSDSLALSDEASRIDKSVLNSLSGSRQMRSNSQGGGLWDAITHCINSSGTYCYAYDDNYVAAPAEAGKEYELARKIVLATGYTTEPQPGQATCSLGVIDICNVTLYRDKFRLEVYITSQPELSDKDIAPLVWRNVHLNLTFK